MENCEDKILNIDSFGNSIWLVKVPTFVAEKLSKTGNEENIGKLIISGKTINVNLKLDQDNDSELDEFFLQDLPLPGPDQHLISFLYNEESGTYLTQGQITKRSILRPKESVKYKQLVLDRGIKASTSREINLAPISTLESHSSSNVIDFIPPISSDQKRKSNADSSSNKYQKTGIAESDRIKTKIFEAFSVNNLQSLKDLIIYCSSAVTTNPSIREKEVKNLLETYARYHSKGSSRGFWELKPEYQKKVKPLDQSSNK